jgi:hypothetical protein
MCYSFVGIRSTAKTGGTITNYSDRFTLTGMTGSFSAAVLAANQNVVGTAGPPSVNQVAAANPGAGGPVDQGAWGTPYNLQVGPTRYAPMQPVPPTKITQTKTAPLWPTSSVPIATTFLPRVESIIQTTITQPQTFSVQSRANTVCIMFRFCTSANILAGCPTIKSHGRHAEIPQSVEGLICPGSRVKLAVDLNHSCKHRHHTWFYTSGGRSAAFGRALFKLIWYFI